MGNTFIGAPRNAGTRKKLILRSRKGAFLFNLENSFVAEINFGSGSDLSKGLVWKWLEKSLTVKMGLRFNFWPFFSVLTALDF